MWKRDLFAVCVCILAVSAFVAVVGPRGAQRQERRHFVAQAQQQDDAIANIVELLNEEIREAWRDHGVPAAPPADDLTVARRVSLALAGTIPSLEEIREFESLSADTRLAWWNDHLLRDRRHADFFAERLARAYVGVEDGPFLIFRRRRFVTWLSDRLYENQPYDELVRQLLTARGLWTDAPAVNFLTVAADAERDNKPDEVRLAGRTVRAFLGVRLDCVQCHDDHLHGAWLQSDFHGLAAFFADAKSSFVGVTDEPSAYRFKFLDAQEEAVVQPEVPFCAELLSAAGDTSRAQLAVWVTHPDNEAFARAMVNRVWALACGRPLVEPLDEVPLAGPYPPGLQLLADDFSRHGYDLRRLWRIVLSTEAFRLDSRAPFPVTPRHERHWSVFPLTRLRPEQVAGALVQSARLTTIDADSHILVRVARHDETDQFVRRYGDTGEDEFGTQGGTIPQRLLMMNGNIVKERTKSDLIGNAATRIARLAPDDGAAIEAAFLTVLTRRPDEQETRYFVNRLSAVSSSERDQFFEDLCWTLLNSTEFSWNH